MTRVDAEIFSTQLLSVFPRMRFVREDYWHKFWDFDAWRGACMKVPELAPLPAISEFVRDPDREPPDYFESLGAERELYFYAWIEPPNWRPRWKVFPNFVRLENMPRLHFLFRRAAFNRHGTGWARAKVDRRTNLRNAPVPEDDDDVITLRGDRMLGAWMKHDESAKAFVHKVWRIASKMTTNLLVAIDERTREPYPFEPQRQMHVWAGPDAVTWAEQRKHNYLAWAGQWYKPPSMK